MCRPSFENLLHFFKRPSEGSGSPKTKGDHLQYVFEKTGATKEDTLFIGDGYTDFKTSRDFGVNFCFLEQMSDWKKNVEQMQGHEDMVTRCKNWDDILCRFDFGDEASKMA